MVPPVGIEPTTPPLPRVCSTPELRRHGGLETRGKMPPGPAERKGLVPGAAGRARRESRLCMGSFRFFRRAGACGDPGGALTLPHSRRRLRADERSAAEKAETLRTGP